MGGTKGQKTEPRKLHPLLVRDMHARVIDWKLQTRVEINEELPLLNREGEGWQALGTYLRWCESWNGLRKQAESQGEQLTQYSYGHRYAKGVHAAEMTIVNFSEAMSYTIEVHLQSYARFMANATSELVQAING